MKRSVLLIILTAGGLFFGQIIFAQGPSIGISPLTFELTGNSGDVIENYIRVYNPSESMIGVKMQVEDIAPTGEAGFVQVEPPETETYSLARWVKCEPEELNLNPNEEKTVRFTITIPQNVEPGGHYGTILAGTKAVAGPGMTGATIVQRVGSLVLLIVPGEMKENLLTKELSTPHNYYEYGPIPFVIKLENEGTVHVKPVMLLTVTNFWGKKVADIEIPQRNVLPGAVRKYDVALNKKWLLGGKYIVTLSGNYGMSNIPLQTAVITFWVFPWKIGVGILILIILFILTRKRWVAALKILIRGER